MESPLQHARTVAWGALWFLVVMTFTAAVGVISAATSVGEMPPLTPNVRTIVGPYPDGPSSAPSPDPLRAG
jgi:hypothetical protein